MKIEDLALTLLPGLGSRSIAQLLDYFGTATTLFARSRAELAEAGLADGLVSAITSKQTFAEAEDIVRRMEREGVCGVASTDEEYPTLLRECDDYPHVLYYKGNIAPLSGRTLAVVGTRTMTPYGGRMTNRLIADLAQMVPDVSVVSGLAFGVDGEAHLAALNAGLHTVAVLPSPVTSVTPRTHQKLADSILSSGGALVSEYRSGVVSRGTFYIPRNRIIAGVAQGTLVVESPAKGGSLYTAEMAYGYNRAVMALPGRVGDRSSEGTNELIVSRRASMVCSATDVVREVGWNVEERAVVVAASEDSLGLSEGEMHLLGCFGEGETLAVDTLVERSGMAVASINALLVGLDIAGVVRQLPGGRYEKV